MKLFTLLCFALLGSGNPARSTFEYAKQPERILARDVDQRPLQEVGLADLSAVMRAFVNRLHGERRSETDAKSSPQITIHKIPVAPPGHRLYLIDQHGEGVCAANGVPNCPQTVVDETAQGLETVTGDGSAGISIARRAHLQMPDIVVLVQEGHFALDGTVYRFSGKRWAAYLCKHIEPIGDDPDPKIVADKPCEP